MKHSLARYLVLFVVSFFVFAILPHSFIALGRPTTGCGPQGLSPCTSTGGSTGGSTAPASSGSTGGNPNNIGGGQCGGATGCSKYYPQASCESSTASANGCYWIPSGGGSTGGGNTGGGTTSGGSCHSANPPSDPKYGACASATTQSACSALVGGFNCYWQPGTSGGGNTGGGNTGGGNTGGGVNPPINSWGNCVQTQIGTPAVPANNNDCNGFYTQGTGHQLNSPLGNFGDPQCTLTQAESERHQIVLKHISDLQSAFGAQNLKDWELLIGCESGFNANAYAPHAVNSDAWGLFQMGPSYNVDSRGIPTTPHPGLAADVTGLNGVSDRGDVNWEVQIEKALQKNKNDNNRFGYWQCRYLFQ